MRISENSKINPIIIYLYITIRFDVNLLNKQRQFPLTRSIRFHHHHLESSFEIVSNPFAPNPLANNAEPTPSPLPLVILQLLKAAISWCKPINSEKYRGIASITKIHVQPRARYQFRAWPIRCGPVNRLVFSGSRGSK